MFILQVFFEFQRIMQLPSPYSGDKGASFVPFSTKSYYFIILKKHVIFCIREYSKYLLFFICKGRSIPLKIGNKIREEPKLEINVSDIALETVKKLLEKDKNKKGIYVYLAGVGCGGGGSASYSLAPVEQEEGENVVIIDGIPFIYDNLMLKHTDKISIDYKPSAYGNEIWLEQFRVKAV